MSRILSPDIDLLEEIDTLDEFSLDTLPVGAIQLDRDGTILRYNQTEGDLTDHDPRDVLGKNFFTEVAPCTRVQSFHGRFVAGVEARDLHVIFPFRFRFTDGRHRDVVVTLFYSRQTETAWVLVSRV